MPHALYGFVSGAEAYSAGRYAARCGAAIAAARASGRVPIIVGGTGLYFKVLLEGLSPVPGADPDGARLLARSKRRQRPTRSCTRSWPRATPRWRRGCMPTDPQRIVRALEVLESTGRSLADWQREPGQPVLAASRDRAPAGAAGAGEPRRPPSTRASSHAGGRARSRRCARLLALGLSAELPIMRALGVAPLAAHLAGRHSLAAAAAAAESADPAVRQTADDMASTQYDFVEKL